MNRFGRRILTFAVALVLIGPAFGGGAYGWANLPGRIRLPGHDRPVVLQQEIGLGVGFILPAGMSEAVVVARVGELPPIVSRSRERRFMISSHIVQALIDAGVREMSITFLTQADQLRRIDVCVKFDVERRTTTIFMV